MANGTGDNGLIGWETLIVALISSMITWVVTIFTTRRQLLDHLKECDKRHEENSDKLTTIDKKLDDFIGRFVVVEVVRRR